VAVTRRTRENQTTQGQRDRARRAAAVERSSRSVPKAPTGLGQTGRDVWGRTWRTCPWLDDTHYLVVVRLAESYDERAELRTEIRTNGRTAVGSTGQPVEAPQIATLRACEVGINRIERQLGIAVSQTRAAAVRDDMNAEAANAKKNGPRLSQVAK
jgi:phage terminase small subunit